jgi:hypothetical protein
MEGVGSLLYYGPTFPLLRASRGRARAMGVLSEQQDRWELLRAAEENVWRGEGELNPRPWLWYHTRQPLLANMTIKHR